MEIGEILTQLGGGPGSVMILGLGFAVYRLWNRVYELHDYALKREGEHSKELIETIRTVDKVISTLENGD